MFTRYIWSMSLVLLMAVGSTQAVPTYLHFSGQITGLVERNISDKNFFDSFIQSMDTGSTYDFTLAYDSDTITPDATNNGPTLDTAVYTSQLSLVSGQVGTYTDFSGWSITLAVFGTGTTFRGDQDYFEIRLANGINTIFLNVNYGDDGAGYVGENAWDTPFEFPTTDELNTPPVASTALFDSRYYNSGLGRQIYYEYTGGEGFAAAAPEPTAALAMIGLLGAMRMRRRRMA